MVSFVLLRLKSRLYYFNLEKGKNTKSFFTNLSESIFPLNGFPGFISPFFLQKNCGDPMMEKIARKHDFYTIGLIVTIFVLILVGIMSSFFIG